MDTYGVFLRRPRADKTADKQINRRRVGDVRDGQKETQRDAAQSAPPYGEREPCLVVRIPDAEGETGAEVGLIVRPRRCPMEGVKASRGMARYIPSFGIL